MTTPQPPQPPEPPGGPPPPYAGFDPALLGAPPGPPPPRYYAPGRIGAGGEWLGPPLASWGQRVVARLVDYAILFAIILVPLVTGSTGVLLLAVLVYIAVWLWMRYREGTTGQTPGKRFARIKVLREIDGDVIGFGFAILREILHSAIDGALCGLGYLWPLWDAKRQTFADKILATVVVTAD
jgi:uncharacterized RDD family membrane protein YckC